VKHLFLSGSINVGKSTIIQDIVRNMEVDKEQIGGFYTKAYIRNGKVVGFYIEPINYKLKTPDIYERLIGYTPDGKMWLGMESTFESFGTSILNCCLVNNYKLIIMDELGFFENDAKCFQEKVHQVLSSNNRIIGCIKTLSTPFMDSIRKRKDVEEIAVTRKNRDSMAQELSAKFVL